MITRRERERMCEVAAAAAAFGRIDRPWLAISIRRGNNYHHPDPCSRSKIEGDGGGGRGGGNINCKLKQRPWKEETSLRTAIPRSRRGLHYPSISAMSSATPTSNDNPDSNKSPADMITFSSTISTDAPLYEPPGVSFDDYLNDRPRIFQAMFPDRRRSQRLNDEEWRIQMLPLQFLFASVNPVVVMRLICKSHGQGYPQAVPRHVTRVLELQATRWELQGLDDLYMPSNFNLNVQGLLYSERKGGHQTRLKGHLQLSISLVLPPLLALVPEDVLRSAAELVLNRLVERMKGEVHGGLLSDFRSFGREKLIKHGEGAHRSGAAVADERGD